MKVAKVGCDMAQRTFRLCILFGKEQREADFQNNVSGFLHARDWLKQSNARKFEIALEPTGRYGEPFADYFWSQKGFSVFYVQPEKFAKYAASRDTRTKSDRKDAIALAKYLCDADRNAQLSEWTPKTDARLELRDVQMRLRSVTKRLGALQSQLKCGLSSEFVRRQINLEIEALEESKRELLDFAGKLIQHDADMSGDLERLQTVPGVGFQTAVFLLCWIDFRKFKASRKLICYLGLSPRKHESGESIRQREHISKKGNSAIRSGLYYQSWVAIWHNPPISQFSDRLQASGKSVPVMRVACLRKLIAICWAVVVSGKDFDPNFKNKYQSV